MSEAKITYDLHFAGGTPNFEYGGINMDRAANGRIRFYLFGNQPYEEWGAVGKSSHASWGMTDDEALKLIEMLQQVLKQ